MADRNVTARQLAILGKDIPLRRQELAQAEKEHAEAKRRGAPQSELYNRSETARKIKEGLDAATATQARLRREQ